MRRWRAAMALIGVVWLAGSGRAFAEAVNSATKKPLAEGEISINLNVNYESAYREGAWVPVDVFVDNNSNDINGFVEVRTFNNDQLQSPVYRVSAQCPKSSRKRFRLHCLLNQTTRVETMVYDKGRPVQAVWPYLDARFIDATSLLGLILDETPMDYSFFNTILYAGKDDPRRFYRENLDNARLAMLADYEQCYTPYDIVIMGAVEPERIAERHRRLISRYVREGGTLVVCTGSNAPNYRHTWVEELAGISVGAIRAIGEAELAKQVFSGDDLVSAKDVRSENGSVGAKAPNDVQVAEIKPVAPDVTVWSSGGAGGSVLATRRSMGRGQVVVLAIDTASKALQDTKGLNRLWQGLCSYRRDRGDLNFQAANSMYSEQLPNVCGIQLYSKSSVMMYLFLYFAIAIVANWMLFSWLKRRELAWLALVVCAIGFTGYAMIFGTAGRAKSARLDQLEVLRVPRGDAAPATAAADADDDSLASLRSTVSLVTARTTRQSFKLSREYSVVQDVKVIDVNYGYSRGPQYANQPNRTFYLQEDIPSRIDQFVVGASDLRLLQVLADVPVKGGFNGTLEHASERLSGTLTNTTGIEIERPFIWFDNQMYTARVDGTTIRVDAAPPHSLTPDTDVRGGMNYGYGPGMYGRATGPSSPSVEAVQRRNLYDRYLNTLFLSNEEIYLRGPRQVPPQGRNPAANRIDMPPLLVAWCKAGPMGSVDPESPVAERGGATIVVADIDVRREGGARRIWYDAVVTMKDSAAADTPQRAAMRNLRMGPNQTFYQFHRDGGPEVEIAVPPEALKNYPGNLVLSISFGGPYPIVFRPKDSGMDWNGTHPSTMSQGGMSNYGMRQRSYDLSDWRSLVDPATGKISGRLFMEQSGAYPPGPMSVEVTAKVLADEPVNKSEDWKPWQ